MTNNTPFWISLGIFLIAINLVACFEARHADHLHKTDQIHGIDPTLTVNGMPAEHHLATAPAEPKTPTPEGVVKPPGAKDTSPQYAWSHSHDHERQQTHKTASPTEDKPIVNTDVLQEKFQNLKDNVQEKIESVLPQTDHKNPDHPILGQKKDKPIINQEVLQEKMQNMKDTVQEKFESVQNMKDNVQEKIASVLPQMGETKDEPLVDTESLKEKMQNTKDIYTAAAKEKIRSMKDQPLVDTEGLKEKAAEVTENVQTRMENFKDNVQEKIETVQEGIQNFKNNVQAKMESVLPHKDKPLVDATNLKERLENSRDLHKAEAKEQARYMRNQPLVDTDGLKEKAAEVKENIQEKAVELKESIEDKASDLKQTAQKKASDLGEAAQEKLDQAIPKEKDAHTEQPKTFVQNIKEVIQEKMEHVFPSLHKEDKEKQAL